VPLEKYSG